MSGADETVFYIIFHSEACTNYFTRTNLLQKNNKSYFFSRFKRIFICQFRERVLITLYNWLNTKHIQVKIPAKPYQDILQKINVLSITLQDSSLDLTKTYNNFIVTTLLNSKVFRIIEPNQQYV